MENDLSKVVEILESDETGLHELAKIVGANPYKFYRGANFRAADLSDEDLSAFDLSFANLSMAKLPDDERRKPRMTNAITVLLVGFPRSGKTVLTAAMQKYPHKVGFSGQSDSETPFPPQSQKLEEVVIKRRRQVVTILDVPGEHFSNENNDQRQGFEPPKQPDVVVLVVDSEDVLSSERELQIPNFVGFARRFVVFVSKTDARSEGYDLSTSGIGDRERARNKILNCIHNSSIDMVIREEELVVIFGSAALGIGIEELFNVLQ